MLVATFPAVPMAPFYYRSLEKDKIRGLKFSKGNFDGTVKISDSSKSDLLWWVNNVYSSKRIITTPSIDMTIYTDASLSGWGINDGYVPSGGPWFGLVWFGLSLGLVTPKRIQVGRIFSCFEVAFFGKTCDRV